MTNLKPLEIEVEGRVIRQVFGKEGGFRIYPENSVLILGTGNASGYAFPVVEIEEKTKPRKMSAIYHFKEVPSIEDILKKEIKKIFQEKPESRNMNGIFFSDSRRSRVYHFDFDYKNLSFGAELEYIEFCLCKYRITDRILLFQKSESLIDLEKN